MRILFFVFFISLLMACANSDKIPGNIIAQRKMETVLSQLMQSDEYVNKQLAKDSSKKPGTEKMKIYQQVFDLNGISLKEFKESYRFYMEHPNITKVMFDSINTKANRDRLDMYKMKTDSVKPSPTPVSILSQPAAAPLLKMDTSTSKLNLLRLKRNKLRRSILKEKPARVKGPIKVQ